MKIYLKTFLGGILAAIGSLVLGAVFLATLSVAKGEFIAAASLDFVILIALIEEILKYGTLKRIFRISLNPRKIFIGSFFLGAGFSSLEIFSRLFGSAGFSINIFFAYLGTFFLHCLSATIFGWYFSTPKHFPKTVYLFWAIAVILHIFFNLAVFYGFNYLFLDIILLIGLFGLIWAGKISGRLLPSTEK